VTTNINHAQVAQVFYLTAHARRHFIYRYINNAAAALQQPGADIHDTAQRLEHSLAYCRQQNISPIRLVRLGLPFVADHAWQLGERARRITHGLIASHGVDATEIREENGQFATRELLLTGKDSMVFMASRFEDSTIIDPQLGILRPTGAARSLFSRVLEDPENRRHFDALVKEAREVHEQRRHLCDFADRLNIKKALACL